MLPRLLLLCSEQRHKQRRVNFSPDFTSRLCNRALWSPWQTEPNRTKHGAVCGPTTSWSLPDQQQHNMRTLKAAQERSETCGKQRLTAGCVWRSSEALPTSPNTLQRLKKLQHTRRTDQRLTIPFISKLSVSRILLLGSELKATSSSVLFLNRQPKDVQFTATDKERNLRQLLN